MANNFVKWLDAQLWRPIKDFTSAHAVWVSLCSDKRNDISRNPFVYQLVSAIALNRWNIVTKWMGFTINPVLGGTFGAWTTSEFAPSRSLEGAIGAGCTTTKIVTTTVITAVWVNMLANRGGSGDYGYKIRVIGKTAGKVEERFIIGNTGGTTPTFTLDAPLSFTPTATDTYEILWGRVFMLNAGVLAASSFRSMEVASNLLANEGTTNLPATVSTDSYMVALDEQFTPYNIPPWSGMILGTFNYDTWVANRMALSATASGASTITGQATLWDSVVTANEYRNFQIRVVYDAVTPWSVGQRRVIASHTGGASPVYTLGTAWTTLPSSSAKYVIENPNIILLRSTATAVVYTYNYNKETINNGTNSIVTNAWHVTYFGNAPAVHWAGNLIMPSYGIAIDPDRNARHSFQYHTRWGGSLIVDQLDIAGSITGTWTSTIVYDGNTTAMTTGTCWDYAPADNEGRMFYINIFSPGIQNQIYRFDVKNRVLSPYTPTNNLQSGTAVSWNRMATYAIIKWASEIYTSVVLQSHLSTNAQEIITQI